MSPGDSRSLERAEVERSPRPDARESPPRPGPAAGWAVRGVEGAARRTTEANGPRWLRFLPVLLLGAAFTAWEIATRGGWISALFYPAPSTIARTLWDLAREGELTANLAVSLARIATGFVCGGGVGLMLGLCMGWSRRLHAALDPLIAAAHPVPRLALLPLILLLFGIGETSRLLVIALSCFFPLLINAVAGVRQIEPIHFEVAHNFGARAPQVLAHVVLPGSLAAVMAGARLALVGALRTTLAIELVTADRGLGYLVWFAWESFQPEILYAAIVVIAALGIGMNAILRRLADLAPPGRGELAL